MGISSKQGKHETFNWVNTNKDNINSIIDIGAGSGTYFNLLSSIKQFNWTAIEVWKEYIDKFQLESKYNIVHNVNILDFEWNDKYDLAVAGDILEHISKDDAISVVNKILDNANTLIISIPIVHMPQEEINDNPYEVHVKDDWSHAEVLETWKSVIIDSWIPTGKKQSVGVYWLRKND